MRVRRFFQRVILPMGFVALAVLLVLLLTYGAGTLGTAGPRRVLQAPPTNPPPLPGTPPARVEPLNPAVVNALERPQLGFGTGDEVVISEDIAPLGSYLPQSGNRQFALVDPTPLPTPIQYPTTPPLPVPPIPGVGLPTLVPGDTARTLPYDGTFDCAPAGLPVDGILTQRFHSLHRGIDIGVRSGTPVIATHSGQVIYADWSPIGYGYLVILQSGAFITYYAHNTSFNVVAGQIVGKGSILAWSGSTGNSTGPHVHYETRINDDPVNPLTFEQRGYGAC